MSRFRVGHSSTFNLADYLTDSVSASLQVLISWFLFGSYCRFAISRVARVGSDLRYCGFAYVTDPEFNSVLVFGCLLYVVTSSVVVSFLISIPEVCCV